MPEKSNEKVALANGFSSPADLAVFVSERWCGVGESAETDMLPDCQALVDFFSVCYHASMLREEERPVTFRAILAPPELFPPQGRPPEGLQRLDISQPLLFQPGELRRLSVAADEQRTLIGVQKGADGVTRIWGLIHSGSRWLRDVRGGRRAGAPLPLALVVQVAAPGSLEVYKGHELVGKLVGGTLSGARMDLFESDWLGAEFNPFRQVILEKHEAARKEAFEVSGERWAPLDPTLSRRIAGRMIKRVISLLRDARHGGTIVFLPAGAAGAKCLEDHDIDLRYKFGDCGVQLVFLDLLVDILNRLASIHQAPDQLEPAPVSWREFETTMDEEIATFDEALFEIAYMIAALAAVDGAVVLSKLHELLGFGGMISSRLAAAKTIARAVDIEGETTVEERTGNVGARHNSAYRLAGALPGAVIIVVSQDGGVRFVCQRDGRVTFWEQE